MTHNNGFKVRCRPGGFFWSQVCWIFVTSLQSLFTEALVTTDLFVLLLETKKVISGTKPPKKILYLRRQFAKQDMHLTTTQCIFHGIIPQSMRTFPLKQTNQTRTRIRNERDEIVLPSGRCPTPSVEGSHEIVHDDLKEKPHLGRIPSCAQTINWEEVEAAVSQFLPVKTCTGSNPNNCSRIWKHFRCTASYARWRQIRQCDSQWPLCLLWASQPKPERNLTINNCWDDQANEYARDCSKRAIPHVRHSVKLVQPITKKRNACAVRSPGVISVSAVDIYSGPRRWCGGGVQLSQKRWTWDHLPFIKYITLGKGKGDSVTACIPSALWLEAKLNLDSKGRAELALHEGENSCTYALSQTFLHADICDMCTFSRFQTNQAKKLPLCKLFAVVSVKMWDFKLTLLPTEWIGWRWRAIEIGKLRSPQLSCCPKDIHQFSSLSELGPHRAAPLPHWARKPSQCWLCLQ